MGLESDYPETVPHFKFLFINGLCSSKVSRVTWEPRSRTASLLFSTPGTPYCVSKCVSFLRPRWKECPVAVWGAQHTNRMFWPHNNFSLLYQPVLGAFNAFLWKFVKASPTFPSQLLWLSVSSKILGSLPTVNSNCGYCCLAVKPWALGKRKKSLQTPTWSKSPFPEVCASLSTVFAHHTICLHCTCHF